jgi:arylsulfatase A-like enzyme
MGLPTYASLALIVLLVSFAVFRVIDRSMRLAMTSAKAPLRICLPLLAALSLPSISFAQEKPNVILVMSDDLGWGDVGFNGSTISKTPHLDEMAASGLRFTRFYAAAPVCSPTRGSALTGRHPYRYGIWFANTGHMKREEITLAEALRGHGYATGFFGKWHLGTLTTKVEDANRGAPGVTDHHSTPAMNGFDVYFATESKVPTWDPMWVPEQFGPGQSLRYGWLPVPVLSEAERYGTRYWDGQEREVEDDLDGDDSRIIMDRALVFVEEALQSSRPFLAVIWFHTPHLPVVTGRKYRDLYRDRPLEEQLYYGAISAMDEQVGRLRAALRRSGAAENTMIWFTSDNGPENGTPGSPGPFRGRKRSLYEGGIRVPALLEWPAKIRAQGATDMPAVTSDYYPTVLDYLGVRPRGQVEPLDGVSLKPLLEGHRNERPRPIGFQTRGMAALSDNRFKLVILGEGKDVELYDILADPSESHDVASQHPSVVNEMSRRLRIWQDSCARSNRGEDYGTP